MRSIFAPLGQLQWPFVAASAAVYVIALVWRASSVYYFDLDDAGTALLVGTLINVVVYALMRTASVFSKGRVGAPD